jgi:hypothetical protein
MNRFCSIFSGLLQLFPKTECFHAVKRTGAERRTKGFSCWGPPSFKLLGNSRFSVRILPNFKS